jgi:hypothetical protein
MNTLGVGMKFCQKHCGHNAFHVMEQQKTSPYHLVYGQEVVLPWEIMAGLRHVEF